MYYDRLASICALVQDVTARMDKLRPLYTLISPRQSTYLLSCALTQYSLRFLASSRHALPSLMGVRLVVSGLWKALGGYWRRLCGWRSGRCLLEGVGSQLPDALVHFMGGLGKGGAHATRDEKHIQSLRL